ncbi:putative methyltransferase NSUN7 isoform X2 [Anneissia japonica]|uniref:putative methyltransferase NSUN7 isoform X2 n=1 Tax=Anneissia japonica TaxID=1529436 RepID=UPI001425A529|nr:putative methyltransferase NSUN7 isoform X2 [Anneissia japonica]
MSLFIPRHVGGGLVGPRRYHSLYTPRKPLLHGTMEANENIYNDDDLGNANTHHIVYLHAGQVFAGLRPAKKSERLVLDVETRPTSIPAKIPVMDEQTKRRIYDLAFATLKYQTLLEDMLVDSGYYSYNTIPDENHSLIMVILCDMISRHFAKLPKTRDDPIIPYIQEIEEDLIAHTTKLNASLARNRIKFQARSVEHLLPEAVREREKCGSQIPTYAWVNELKSSVANVVAELEEDGYQKLGCLDLLEEYTFAKDTHCSNVLVFSAQQREELSAHDLVKSGSLIIQDKTSCLGPHSLKSLLNEGEDILHTMVGSGWTTAHIATLCNQEKSTIYACGVKTDEKLDQLTINMERLGIHNVKLIKEDFFELQHTDPRFKNVKLALVTPQDSRSGITNPVEYIIHEGEDASILRELSQENTDEDKLDGLVSRHMDTLKHAMKFPRVQAVVYTTCSIHEAENENVVTKVTEYLNARNAGSRNNFRLIPPVLPLTQKDLENQTSDRFLKINPSPLMGGCFVAVISREDEALTASDILARAAAKGLCDTPEGNNNNEEEKAKSKRRSSKSKGISPKSSKSNLNKKTPTKHMRSSKSSLTSKISDSSSGTSPPATTQRKSRIVRTASDPSIVQGDMFAHHFNKHPSDSGEDIVRMAPEGVPQTQATIQRIQPKVLITQPHQAVISHPKPFV